MGQAASDAVATGRPYGGLSPEERRAERRDRLLATALELYGTVGYHATSVAQLCRAARMAPGKFYEAFPSTEDLLVELGREIWRPVRARILAATAEAAPDVEAMARALVSGYVHGLLDDPRRARVICVELPAASFVADAARRKQTDQFARLSLAGFQMLLQGQGESERRLSDDQMAMLASALLGALQEGIRYWMATPEPRPPVDDLVEMLMTVYTAVGRHIARPARRPT